MNGIPERERIEVRDTAIARILREDAAILDVLADS